MSHARLRRHTLMTHFASGPDLSRVTVASGQHNRRRGAKCVSPARYTRAVTDGRVGVQRHNTEKRIADAAVHLFALQGFSATGIRQIADDANVATSALYYYAPNKNALLLKVMMTGLTELLSSGRAAMDDSIGPKESIRGLVRVHVTFGTSNPERARVIDNEVQWLSDPDRTSVMALRDKYELLWSQAITDGVNSGEFWVRDKRLARLALLEMCNGAAHWYRPEGSLTISHIVDVFQDMALALLHYRVIAGR